MGDTPTTPVIRLRRIALATLSYLSPMSPPRLWLALIGAIRLGGRPFRACNPKSEHLQSAPNIAIVGNMDVNFI